MARKKPFDQFRTHKPYEPSPEEIAAECRKIREESGPRREDETEAADYSRRHTVHWPGR